MARLNAILPNKPVDTLVARAHMTLGMTQEELGVALGVSKRTVSRWYQRGALLSLPQLVTLAQLVYPHDAQLAEEIANAASETLESLGLVVPPPVAQPAPPPPPVPTALVVEAVVCAAADALNAPPSAVRTAVFAAFRRARELRLSVDDVDAALAPAPAPAKAERAASQKKKA